LGPFFSTKILECVGIFRLNKSENFVGWQNFNSVLCENYFGRKTLFSQKYYSSKVVFLGKKLSNKEK
jgi:hypothetical protein